MFSSQPKKQQFKQDLLACIIFLLLTCFTTSCSVLPFSGDKDSNKQAGGESIDEEQEAPISLEIAQAFYDGDLLRIKTYVLAKTKIETDHILVIAQGLENGALIEEQAKLVRDAFPSNYLEKGQRALLTFALPSSRLTEYQVRCIWGTEVGESRKPSEISSDRSDTEDGKTGEITELGDVLATATDKPQDQEKTVKDLSELVLNILDTVAKDIPCDSPPCDVIYTLEALLINNSANVISEIRLGLGLYWQADGSNVTFPTPLTPLTDDEEEIALATITLAPGANKKIRVSVDRAVPIISGGSFIPQLRIVSYE